jgi:uncharacterized membrane protein YedE/YeeE
VHPEYGVLKGFQELLFSPWPWYVAGPMIGLVVPMLLLIGNRPFGISSSFRHVCAAFMPSGLQYFQYEWRREIWSLVFVVGIAIGGGVATAWLSHPGDVTVMAPALARELARYGIDPQQRLLPRELFSWTHLTSVRTLLVTVVGGLLVGFGSRYAGGCTGGHAITGIATFQRASIIATLAFMAGGFLMANLVLPVILRSMP